MQVWTVTFESNHTVSVGLTSGLSLFAAIAVCKSFVCSFDCVFGGHCFSEKQIFSQAAVVVQSASGFPPGWPYIMFLINWHYFAETCPHFDVSLFLLISVKKAKLNLPWFTVVKKEEVTVLVIVLSQNWVLLARSRTAEMTINICCLWLVEELGCFFILTSTNSPPSIRTRMAIIILCWLARQWVYFEFR